MKQDFQGRKVIVTGAATGIGRATAEALVAAGASVALWDIGKKGIPSAWPFTGARFRKELKEPDFSEYLTSR